MSNQDGTVYEVDGVQVGEGRYLRILVNDQPHRVRAKPPGYVAKEDMLHPPYEARDERRFTFLIEDQERWQAPGATLPGMPGAAQASAVLAAPAGASASGAAAQSSAPPAPSTSFVPGTPQPNAFALVIGIEHYRDLPSPTGAHADAQRFAQLAQTTLGIPARNVRLALDDHASKSDIQMHLAWLASNVPPSGRIYFYFSGHGAPDASQGTPYIVPYDGNRDAVAQTAIPLADVVSALEKTPARDVLAVLDSCFSGEGNRSVIATGVRPLVRVRDVRPAAAKVALYSGASGAQVSGPAPTNDGGLFTKFVLEGLGTGQADSDGDGQITLQELASWVDPRVSREAKRQGREQDPSVATATPDGSAGFIVAYGVVH